MLWAGVGSVSFSAITLDWIFNTNIKAWEYLEIAPKVYLLCWIAYALSVLGLVIGGVLLGLVTAWLNRD
jgi:predicted DNA repair protein MutK